MLSFNQKLIEVGVSFAATREWFADNFSNIRYPIEYPHRRMSVAGAIAIDAITTINNVLRCSRTRRAHNTMCVSDTLCRAKSGSLV
jgi:hypothetical protein